LNGFESPEPQPGSPPHSPAATPRIGITAEGRAADDSIILPSEYIDAVVRAGGLPVLIAPWQGDVTRHLPGLQGLILAGGGDVAPEQYGSPGHPAIYEVDPERDAGELALLHAARARGLPLLGICRGAQLLNVALGGTLIEHLPEHFAGPPAHRADPPGAAFHTVALAAGSRLARTLQADAVTVVSWHHQAIRDLAPGLVAVAWADDGCIEAAEVAPTEAAGAVDAPWLLAVQWHPELSAADDPAQQRLFDALVAAARRQPHPVASLPACAQMHRATPPNNPTAFQVEGQLP
jgi:putative glutamine amidotransferase